MIQGGRIVQLGVIADALKPKEKPRWSDGRGVLSTPEFDNHGRPLRMRRIPLGIIADELCPCSDPMGNGYSAPPGGHTHSWEAACPLCGYYVTVASNTPTQLPSHDDEHRLMLLGRGGTALRPCRGVGSVVVPELQVHVYFGGDGIK